MVCMVDLISFITNLSLGMRLSVLVLDHTSVIYHETSRSFHAYCLYRKKPVRQVKYKLSIATP